MKSRLSANRSRPDSAIKLRMSAGAQSFQNTMATSNNFFGLYGHVLQEEGSSLYGEKFLPPVSATIVAVAERQVAHFKARLVFRLATPSVEIDDLKLELPSANLIVYYLQAIIGDVSIYRIGIQYETEDSLVYNFGTQSIRSSVEVIIRGSFQYLENSGVGLVTLVFPSLVGNCPRTTSGDATAVSGLTNRWQAEDTRGRELRLDVQCLLSLPSPCVRSLGCQLRSVSPDGCRVFLRYVNTGKIWESVEFCVMCGVKSPDCPIIVLQHPEQQQEAEDFA